MVKKVTVFLAFYAPVLLSLSAVAHADFKQSIYEKWLNKKYLTEAVSFSIFPRLSTQSGSKTEVFDQKLDHFNKTDLRTFKQEYYFSADFAKNSNAPVLFFVCGEAKCSANAMYRNLKYTAQKLGAYMIGLEHRYYGSSQPFYNLQTENLKYLNVDQALADLKNFQEFAIQKMGLQGKWITVGGSYPAALSAYYRVQYPEMTSGAWASSAPVEARENFEEYDLHVTNTAGVVCAEKIRNVNLTIDRELSNPEKAARFREMFDAQDIISDDDFLYAVADLAAFAIQYGLKDSFCNALETADDELSAYASFAVDVYKKYGFRAVQATSQVAIGDSIAANAKDIGMRQWLYQSCQEFGFWQTAYHDQALSVRSPRINLNYHNQICRNIFGIQKPVDVTILNQKYYKPLIDKGLNGATQVYFTNGSQDPWMLLSVAEKNGNATNPNVFSQVIEGAAHCGDLVPYKTTELPSITKTRAAIVSTLLNWLK